MSAIAERLAARIGDSWEHAGWVEITQEMVDTFADLTGDRQWIHIDVERAKAESPFGTTVAHGLMVFSMVPGLIGTPEWMTGSAGVNYGSDRMRFMSPVRVGSRIRAIPTLTAVEPYGDGARITTAVRVEIEGQDKPACLVDMIGILFP